MSKPKMLDLCCCQGGASVGYHRAGFDMTGVDNVRQPRYPFNFIHADAIAFLRWLVESGKVKTYAAIVGSPPCQRHTKAQRIMRNKHPDLIEPMRELMIYSGLPYVIENVPGAPLKNPVELCGATLGLRTYRHRLFESNIDLVAPEHQPHTEPTIKMGRAVFEGEFYHAVGNFSNVDYVRRDMGVEWMTRDGIRESIPPAYTEHIGKQLMVHLG